ncbi:uncharacterized protein SCDLUD_004406 [Saccharomycodes ludwigii]|uniref:uncharacterized protein n=1 Tax=Saccharomycodes ludwigii TaxID=36035 RepID=UPI001E86A7BE|nr:hypothetical protein SCDLUD_004406 [Saccharomycodes ludwigii]KAH3900085.1 hypothetical protein SCDLUD_004406 [Saccharomycodes ludwigii]
MHGSNIFLKKIKEQMLSKYFAYLLLIIPKCCDIIITIRQYKKLSSNDSIRLPPGLSKYINKTDNLEKTRSELLLQIVQGLCLLLTISIVFLLSNVFLWLWFRASELSSCIAMIFYSSENKLQLKIENNYKNNNDFYEFSNKAIFDILLLIFFGLLKLVSVLVSRGIYYGYSNNNKSNNDKKSLITNNNNNNNNNNNKRISKANNFFKLRGFIFYTLLVVFPFIMLFFMVIIIVESNLIFTVGLPLFLLALLYGSLFGSLIGLLIIALPRFISYIGIYIMFLSPKVNIRNSRKLEEENYSLYQNLMKLCNNSEYEIKNKVSDIYIIKPSTDEQNIITLCGLPFGKKKLYLSGNMFESCDTNKTKKDDQIYTLILLQLMKRKKIYTKYSFFTFVLLLILSSIALATFFKISVLVNKNYESVLSSFGFAFSEGDSNYPIVIGTRCYSRIGIIWYPAAATYLLSRLFFLLLRWINKKKFNRYIMGIIDQGYGKELYYAMLNLQFNPYNRSSSPSTSNLLLYPDHLYIHYFNVNSIELYLFLNGLLQLTKEDNKEQNILEPECDEKYQAGLRENADDNKNHQFLDTLFWVVFIPSTFFIGYFVSRLILGPHIKALLE